MMIFAVADAVDYVRANCSENDFVVAAAADVAVWRYVADY
jgi:hypothetical protein